MELSYPPTWKRYGNAVLLKHRYQGNSYASNVFSSWISLSIYTTVNTIMSQERQNGSLWRERTMIILDNITLYIKGLICVQMCANFTHKKREIWGLCPECEKIPCLNYVSACVSKTLGSVNVISFQVCDLQSQKIIVTIYFLRFCLDRWVQNSTVLRMNNCDCVRN